MTNLAAAWDPRAPCFFRREKEGRSGRTPSVLLHVEDHAVPDLVGARGIPVAFSATLQPVIEETPGTYKVGNGVILDVQ